MIIYFKHYIIKGDIKMEIKKVESYEIFSRFYDKFIEKNCPALHDKYVELVENTIEKSGSRARKILDCTCGTGILMEKLKKKGYEVKGIDISKEMLQEAEKKGLDVVRGDIANIDLKDEFDMVLSFDSLGHISTKREFAKVMKNMKKLVKKDGIVLFDGGTKDKADRMARQTYTYDSEEYSFVWENKSIGKGQVEVSLKIKDNQENEYVEKFLLCGHDIDEVREGVEEAGLKIELLTLEEKVKKGSFVCWCKK